MVFTFQIILPKAAMPPYCKVINFTPTSLSWLQEMILGDKTSLDNTTHQWKVVTKNYKADMVLKILQHKASMVDTEDFTDTEAIVFYCDTSKDTLENVETVWLKIKESSPAVCLLVVETATDDVKDKKEASRTQILDWCLSNQFELVECNEENDDESDSEEQFDEKAGRQRILQALKAHTWSNLELIEDSEDKDEQADEDQRSSLLMEAKEVNNILLVHDLVTT